MKSARPTAAPCRKKTAQTTTECAGTDVKGVSGAASRPRDRRAEGERPERGDFSAVRAILATISVEPFDRAQLSEMLAPQLILAVGRQDVGECLMVDLIAAMTEAERRFTPNGRKPRSRVRAAG
jgi:hypothetical protein